MKALKVWRIGLLSAAIAVLGSVVVAHPDWLSKNTLLATMMTHELISILVVILTVTLASVANIHLAITRMTMSSQGDRDVVRLVASEVRKEINDNAWTIFWSFVAAILVLIWKGAFPNNEFIVAACHAIGLIVVMLNVLVLHDLYRATFKLAAADPSGPGS